MANTTDKSILTAAGKALLAQLNAEEKPLIIDKMIFANIPNRPEFPQPDDVVPTDDIVHQEQVEQRGRLSTDSVIYSATLTSDVGPFEFNWTGAYCSEYGVLVTIDHHALTPKTADEPGVAGNTLVRSVVLEYKDIAEITNITVDASSWQYNATDRMKKMDSDVAQSIIDQNGKDWFIADGFLVTPSGSAYKIKAGAGYVSGNRVSMEFDRSVKVPSKPSFIYIDAYREGTPTGEQETLFNFIVTAEEKDDYIDSSAGKDIPHYVCKIAQVHADGSVSDLRPEGESADKTWVSKEEKLQTAMLSERNLLAINYGHYGRVLDGVGALQVDNWPTGEKSLWYAWDTPHGELADFIDNGDYGTATIVNTDGNTFEFINKRVYELRVNPAKTVYAEGFGADHKGVKDSTDAVRRMALFANANNYKIDGGEGELVIRATDNPIPLTVDADFSRVRIRPDTVQPQGKNYVIFKCPQDWGLDLTDLIDQSKMVKGAHRLYSKATNSPINLEGFVMIESDDIVRYRFNDDLWTPVYKCEPLSMSGYWGDLSKPLYFDYTNASGLKIRFKPQKSKIKIRFGEIDLSNSKIYDVCTAERCDVEINSITFINRNNDNNDAIYTVAQNLYCNNTKLTNVDAGQLGSELNTGYFFLANKSDNTLVEGAQNRLGWGGIDGNHFSRLTVKDSTVYSVSSHAYGMDIVVKDTNVYRYSNIHGAGKFILENVKLLSQGQKDVYENDYMVRTRTDYGSSWDGIIKIINPSIEAKRELSKFDLVFIEGAPTSDEWRGEDLNYIPDIVLENIRFRSESSIKSHITVNLISIHCPVLRKDWIKYTYLPSSFSIKHADVKASNYVRIKSVKNTVEHVDDLYFLKRYDKFKCVVENVDGNVDPAYAKRWSEISSVYGIDTFAIPDSSAVNQSYRVVNSDWHAPYLRSTMNIKFEMVDSECVGPWIASSMENAGNIYSLDPDSQITFSNCRVLKLWGLGSEFDSIIMPTLFLPGTIFDWQSYYTGDTSEYDPMFSERFKKQIVFIWGARIASPRGANDVVTQDVVNMVKSGYSNATVYGSIQIPVGVA
ncbi:phage tail protein [Vibrio parahaemolyticus]|uniref:phage tail-collar fiber domain-containing protein n=1 Tax=Vibrio parahaemolyticus TaxID=670 RepID=UPI00235E93B0|nr:phage tail protein [Vibrio parahaemolyticus]